MTIKEWLNLAHQKYSSRPEFSRLDAEIILCEVLSDASRLDRSELILHEDYELTNNQIKSADKLLRQRFLKGCPLAYILKEKEFYGRTFYVDERVLIPRPETESIINVVKEITKKFFSNNTENLRVIDIGTGSSCIATTLKLELPEADIAATDISKNALEVAKINSDKFRADIKLLQSDLLKDVSETYQLYIANLPYVDKKWEWISKNLRFEPKKALFASDGGLLIIKKFLTQIATKISSQNITSPIYIVLEFDPSQKPAVRKFIKQLEKNSSIKFEEVQKLNSLKETEFITVLAASKK